MSRLGERGSVLAEFAITSIVALTIIFAIIDFGRALYMTHLVSEGARMGARYAIVNATTACPGGNPNPDPLLSYVSALTPLAGQNALTVTTTCANTTLCANSSSTNCSNASGCTSNANPYNTRGCLVTVKVDYSFNFLVPLVSRLTLPMTSSSTMAISK